MAEPSLNEHLGRMEPDEFLLHADQLRALKASPGWAFLMELVAVEDRKKQVALSAQPLPRVEDYAWRHGELKGLRKVADIVEGVIKLADQTAAQIEAAFKREDESA
jgi:hypothetical protein